MNNINKPHLSRRWDDELCHSGIKGQKWGVRRFQNLDRTWTEAGKIRYGRKGTGRSTDTSVDKKVLKNLKNARTSNLDKWGKSEDSNTLYITGYSGSGKSTVALGLKKHGDTVVHLDGYTEGGDGIESIQDEKFNNYLDKNLPRWKELYKSAREESDVKQFSKEYWKIVDGFLNAIENYSKKEYKNGNRVIVEGVQIADDWFGDKNKLKNKPVVVLNTNPLSSMSRAFERDGRGNLIKALTKMDDPKDYVKWVVSRGKTLKDISSITESKKNQKYIREFLQKL